MLSFLNLSSGTCMKEIRSWLLESMNDYALVGFGIARDVLDNKFRYGEARVVSGMVRLGSTGH